MTDNEIIKALECCTQQAGCNGCPFVISNEMKYRGGYACAEEMRKNALDLINLQKAEIERLKKKANTPFAKVTLAIKDFAHLVIDRSRNGVIYASDIPDLVKEMTEQANFEKIEHNSLCETETYMNHTKHI